MPITIKELFPSDPISEALEKINFNFDQLILAGGGPPGPSGPLGPQGVPGPQGDRGDHWFVGASAFGQTADHDGGSLEIADHFLDDVGEVYEYFDSAGITGWTATNVNLKGPTGDIGPTGGNVDFGVFAGHTGNAQSTDGFYPDPSNTIQSSETDFLIPTQMYKNSIFVGDVGWAYNYLKDFGGYNSIDQDEVPKLSLIQKEVNIDGLNGLAFGAYGALPGSTSIGNPEGGVGSTTTANDFVYFGLGKPFAGADNGTPVYQREFRIKSFTQNIRIEAGGNLAKESQVARIELASSGLSWINNKNGQRFLGNNTFTQNIMSDITDVPGFNDMEAKIIEFNSIPGLRTDAVGDVNSENEEGALILQNRGGSIPSGFNMNDHGYGNVIIGPTTTGSLPIAVQSQQGLAIVRPITGTTGNNDASIRFFHEDNLNTSGMSNVLGGIRAGRDEFSYTGGDAGTISYIQIGSGTPTDVGGTATQVFDDVIGGKIGINNHPGWSNDLENVSTPWFPIHLNLVSYPETGENGYSYPTSPASGVAGTTGINRWIFGIDSTGNTAAGLNLTSSGIGFAYSESHRSVPNNEDYETRSLIMQSYYSSALDQGEEKFNGQLNPHVYFQIGEGSNKDPIGGANKPGNLGLGFYPHDNDSKSIMAYDKLSIDGGLTIGSSDNYHNQNSDRQLKGILVEGRISQGSYDPQLFTSIFDSTGSSAIANQIGIISAKSIWGRSFISREDVNSDIPQFSLPDLRTGMIQDIVGEGNLVVPDHADAMDPSMGPTGGYVKTARFSRKSSEGKNGEVFKPAFVAEKAFVLSPMATGNYPDNPDIYTLQDLANRGYAMDAQYLGTGNAVVPYKKVFFEIPTESSNTMIDLSNDATFGHWNTGGNWVSGTTSLYLTGKKRDGNYYPLLPDQFRFVLQPGSYNGQILNLMIFNVNGENSRMHTQIQSGGALKNLSRIHPEQSLPATRFALSSNSSTTTSGTFNRVLYDDIVMARDYVTPAPLSNEWNNNAWNSALDKSLPWPLPGGGVTENQGGDRVVAESIATNDAVSGWSPKGTFIFGSGFRNIQFIWVNDPETAANPNYTIAKGYWIETGRQILAPRSLTQYSPTAPAQESEIGSPVGTKGLPSG